MSLNKFLAVGRSFIGIRSDKSPYAMSKEAALPRFQPSARFNSNHAGTTAGPLVQRDWVQETVEKKHAEAVAVVEKRKEMCSEKLPSPPSKAKRGLVWYLSFGLLGRRRADSELVQTELRLEKVKVLRNDLADSDLELVIRKKKKVATHAVESQATVQPSSRPPERGQWSELTAKLFEIGQH
jgi:hypothetical protein